MSSPLCVSPSSSLSPPRAPSSSDVLLQFWGFPLICSILDFDSLLPLRVCSKSTQRAVDGLSRLGGASIRAAIHPTHIRTATIGGAVMVMRWAYSMGDNDIDGDLQLSHFGMPSRAIEKASTLRLHALQRVAPNAEEESPPV